MIKTKRITVVIYVRKQCKGAPFLFPLNLEIMDLSEVTVRKLYHQPFILQEQEEHFEG